jgi:hypothetical protein
MKPLFNGQSEISQINKIFKELGTPSDKIWPGPPAYSELPATKKMTFADYPYNNLRNKFGATLTDKGFDLLNRYVPCACFALEQRNYCSDHNAAIVLICIVLITIQALF